MKKQQNLIMVTLAFVLIIAAVAVPQGNTQAASPLMRLVIENNSTHFVSLRLSGPTNYYMSASAGSTSSYTPERGVYSYTLYSCGAYVHGEIFGTMGLKTKPDNPRGTRSKSAEKRCKGKGQWNKYTIVCVDGVIKLSVNGKFVNGISHASLKKGYICLESEGAEIHFRNIRILQLPPGITTPENTAQEVIDNK